MNAALPFPQIDPVLVEIPIPFFDVGVPIRWYALAYIAGLVLGWLYIRRMVATSRLWPAGRAPLNREQADDLLFIMTLGVVIGGRLGTIFYPSIDGVGFWDDPFRILRIWEGGMAFHGGILGVAVAAFFYARSLGAPPLSLGDMVACAAPFGLFFGRIANFINDELWGRPTDAPWGMVFPNVERLATNPNFDYGWLLVNGVNAPRHPSQLYEAALEGALLFALLAYLAWRRGAFSRPGLCMGVFLAGYGVARFTAEFFRQWNVEFGPEGYASDFGLISRGQTLCLPMIALGGYFIWRALSRPPAASTAPARAGDA